MSKQSVDVVADAHAQVIYLNVLWQSTLRDDDQVVTIMIFFVGL